MSMSIHRVLLIDIGRQVFMKILIIFGRKEFEERTSKIYIGDNDYEQEFRSLISYLRHR